MNIMNPVQTAYGNSAISPFKALTVASHFNIQKTIPATAIPRTDTENVQLQTVTTNSQAVTTESNPGSTAATSLASDDSRWSLALRDAMNPGGGSPSFTLSSQTQRAMNEAFPSQVVNLYTQAQNMLTANGTFSTLF
jgi:hypothetical protein